MPKTRFTSLDVSAVVRDLRSQIIGLRIANVYDLNNKTYHLKLQKPDVRVFLLIESGVRVHTTDFTREHKASPSVFAGKLRKAIRTKRINDIRQIGTDRVIDFTIGIGPGTFHLIVELYSKGNIILTDGEYIVVHSIRSHSFTEEDVIGVGHPYPLHRYRELVPLQRSRLGEMVAALSIEDRPTTTLKQMLNNELVFGPTLIKHSILLAGLPQDVTISDCGEDELDRIHRSIQELEGYYDQDALKENTKGYIILKPEKSHPPTKKDGKSPPHVDGDGVAHRYMEFVPFLYEQLKGQPAVEYASFNQACDEYFSSKLSQKVDAQRGTVDGSVDKKMAKFIKIQNDRILSLKAQEDLCRRKAGLIQDNIDQVQEAITMVNGELSTGIDWNELQDVVKEAALAGDPIAMIISRLALDKNEMVLTLTPHLLEHPPLDDDSEETPPSDPGDRSTGKGSKKTSKRDKPIKVTVNLALSAYANAQEYYAQMKAAKDKHDRTVLASDKAMKGAMKKAERLKGDMSVRQKVIKIRKKYWFEKFYWFISSENYVVISGRDAHQNELIVKRYLRKGDVYVHADVHGAATTIVKNHTPSEDIPPLTLDQAGAFCVCRSRSWREKIVSGSWWVHSEQVSKTAPSGEYLPTGSFMIRGRKNFMVPQPLVMGFALLFNLDEDSMANHIGERAVKGTDEDDDWHEDVKQNDEKHLRKFEKKRLHRDEKEMQEMMRLAETALLDAEKSTSASRNKLKRETAPIQDVEKEDDDHHIVKDGQGEEDASEKDTNDEDTIGDEAKDDEASRGTRGSLSNSSSKHRAQLLMSAPTDDGHESEDDGEEEEEEALEEHEDGGTLVEEKHDPVDPKSQTDGRLSRRPRLSAAEKRRMKREKKWRDRGLSPPPSQPRPSKSNQRDGAQDGAASRSDGLSSDVDAPSTKAYKKRPGKLKKIQKKYKDQDEEERAIRMAILGSAGPSELSKRGPSSNPSDASRMKSDDASSRETTQSVDGKEDHRGKRTSFGGDGKDPYAGLSVAERKRREQEEIRAILEQENIKAIALEKTAQSTNIDSLTGLPREDDGIEFAIPMCAPYTVVSQFKYKVKVVPGTGKKGSTAKMAMANFLKLTSATEEEKNLIKSLNVNDALDQIMGEATIATYGKRPANGAGRGKRGGGRGKRRSRRPKQKNKKGQRK